MKYLFVNLGLSKIDHDKLINIRMIWFKGWYFILDYLFLDNFKTEKNVENRVNFSEKMSMKSQNSKQRKDFAIDLFKKIIVFTFFI